MAIRKRPIAVLATTSCKRRRTRIGSTDEYEEMTCLGEGGFGVVPKARHRATGKTVAIKRLSSPDETEEGVLLAACSGNPYVVGFEGLVRDHAKASGNLCLVMEYVAAPSLHTLMWDGRHDPPLPESKVRAIMWKLLTGAKMMHDLHVVHRDIKPPNILIGEDGELVKICDLGLAISMSADSPPYYPVGTVPYMAPEMLLHKPDYDALVDTWSLGCVMAEMLTGENLFDDDDDDDQMNELNDTETDHIFQLWSIFQVLGMPDDQTWPEFKHMPLTAKARQLLPEGQMRSRLREILPADKLSEQGFQVLQGLLTCNPQKRLTAAKVEALPLPTKKTPHFMVARTVLKAQWV